MSDAGRPEGDDYLLRVDNPLVVPVDKKVRIITTANDVIHAWGVPSLGVKQDAIPGYTIPVYFTADVTTDEMRSRTGNAEFQYEIAWGQLCGLGHYRMRGFVTVQSAADFQTWMDQKVKEQLEAASNPFR